MASRAANEFWVPVLKDMREQLPNGNLFASRAEAHKALYDDIRQPLLELKALGCFPSEKAFLRDMRDLLEVYYSLAPSD